MTLRFAGLLALVPVALAGQEPTDTVELNPVVVTATRLPTHADAVTASVVVIPGAELRARGIRTVADALRAVPGAAVIQIGSFGGQTSLFLRGGESDYVKVLVDGVAVNQPGGAFDFAHLTTDNVERIEVVRGPASVLYGSDAMTGVVQVFTRQGAGAARGDVSLRGGTYGTVAWDATVSGGNRTAGYAFSMSHFRSDGIYDFNNGYRNTTVSGLVRVAPDDRTDATVALRYGDDVYHFPTNGAGIPRDHNQYNFGSGPTLAVDVGHYVTSRFETRLQLSANETDGGLDNRPDSSADSTVFRNLDYVRRASADARANLYIRPTTVLTGGAALEQQRERSFTVCQTAFGDCSGAPVEQARWNAAFYAQAVAEIGRRLSLNAGARLEDNQRFGTFTTYRLGAAYRLVSGTRLRSSVGNGFREPTFFENYATGFVVGNPDLRPERSRTWELAVEQALAQGRATASAVLFDQRFRDMIDYDPAAPTGSPNYANVARATARGVELGVRAVPLAHVSLAASYTYLRTDVTNPGFDASSGAELAAGQPLLRRPRRAARLDVDFQPGERSTVSLAVTYVGDRLDRDFSTFPFPRVTLPSYARVDCAAQLEVRPPRDGVPGLALSARLDNVFDRGYQEVKNFPARRRTLLFGGQVRFGT